MDIKELRFGNIVLLNNPKSWNELQNIPMKVKGIGINPTPLDGVNETITVEKVYKNKYKIHENYSQYAQFIEPIRLTEEWIVKLGFNCINRTKMAFKLYHNNENADFSSLILKEVGNNPIWFYAGNNRWTINPFTVEIKYVHQLQNLYFALSEKELVVSDTVS
jgi:hypothetical protein